MTMPKKRERKSGRDVKIPERVEERFHHRTAELCFMSSRMDTPCSLWLGAIMGRHYGVIEWCDARKVERITYAHSLSYRLDRLEGRRIGWGGVYHRCDVRICVNPDHLYHGQSFQNAADYILRGPSEDDERAMEVRQRFLMLRDKLRHYRELRDETARLAGVGPRWLNSTLGVGTASTRSLMELVREAAA